MSVRSSDPHGALLARHRAALPDWMTPCYGDPIEFATGSGRHVTDGAGNRYLDFFAGVLTSSVG